jgi:hypothetical protein
MKIAVQNLIVDKDMVLKASKQVWPWEVPVLQEKHGEGKVRLLDTAEVERRELPDAGQEFVRLGKAHGIDGGQRATNLPYVELAYGRGRSGVKELAKEIKKSVPKTTRATKKKTAKKPEPVAETPTGEGVGDPLEF